MLRNFGYVKYLFHKLIECFKTLFLFGYFLIYYKNYNSYNDVTVYSSYGYSYETYKFRIYAYGHSVDVKVSDYSY